MKTQENAKPKIGRPMRGSAATVKKSVTLQPAVWEIVEKLAASEIRSVSAALEVIVSEWAASRRPKKPSNR